MFPNFIWLKITFLVHYFSSNDCIFYFALVLWLKQVNGFIKILPLFHNKCNISNGVMGVMRFVVSTHLESKIIHFKFYDSIYNSYSDTL